MPNLSDGQWVDDPMRIDMSQEVATSESDESRDRLGVVLFGAAVVLSGLGTELYVVADKALEKLRIPLAMAGLVLASAGEWLVWSGIKP